MAQAAECLNTRKPSLNAFVQHTGGGIFCIELHLDADDQFMYWGTSGETRCGDLNSQDGEYLDVSLSASISSGSKNADKVANAVIEAIRHYGNTNSEVAG